MKKAITKGFSFGLSSGIITTLGLVVGLNSSTGSGSIVISGILVIAVADAMSDALGIHISEEADSANDHIMVWVSTICTFLAKFVFSAIFIIPFLLLGLDAAVVASLVMGLTLIASFSFYMARAGSKNPLGVVAEHLFIAVLVVFLSHLVGHLVSNII